MGNKEPGQEVMKVPVLAFQLQVGEPVQEMHIVPMLGILDGDLIGDKADNGFHHLKLKVCFLYTNYS